MSILDNYRMAKSPRISGHPFFTVNHNAILFSKKAVEVLDYAPFVHAYFDDANSKFAIQPCTSDSDALVFYKPLSDGRKSVRWSKKDYVDYFVEHSNGNVSPDDGFRVSGEYYPDENVIIFDLKNASPSKLTTGKKTPR